jgi:hypothetical protein
MIMAGQEPGFESDPRSLADNARGAKGLNPWGAPGECPGLKLDARMGESVANTGERMNRGVVPVRRSTPGPTDRPSYFSNDRR